MVKRDLTDLEKEFGAKAATKYWERAFENEIIDPKKIKFPDEDNRVFPGYYAPVICFNNLGERVIEPMRYSIYPPKSILDPQKYKAFNARRDSLRSNFWSESFMIHHGILAISGFFEWVSVSKLLKENLTTMEEVREEFRKQLEDRKAKVLQQGKKWCMTPTESKDPRFRQIVIAFTPSQVKSLITPILYSVVKDEQGVEWKGFAIITDTPSLDIRRAGHDRMPIFLKQEAIDLWLNPQGRRFEEIDSLFELYRDTDHFQANLMKSA